VFKLQSPVFSIKYCLLQHTKTLHSAHTVCLCVPYGYHNNQRPFHGRTGPVTLTTWHPLSTKVGTNFANKGRSLGRYSSLADSGLGV
jgi:hypothetical protein